MSTDHYQTLGLPRQATSSQIKAQFKLLAKKYHPDVAGDNDKMSAINGAYAVLVDPKRRLSYDRTLELEDYDDLTSRHQAAPRRAPSNRPATPRRQSHTAAMFSSPDTRRRFSIFAYLAYGTVTLGVLTFVFIGILHATKISAASTAAIATVSNGFPGVGSQSASAATTAQDPQSTCYLEQRQAQTQITRLQSSIATIQQRLAQLSQYAQGATPDMVKAQQRLLNSQLTTYQNQLTTLQTSTSSC